MTLELPRTDAGHIDWANIPTPPVDWQVRRAQELIRLGMDGDAGALVAALHHLDDVADTIRRPARVPVG